MSREHEKKIEKYIELWSASSHLFPHFKDNSMNSLGLGPSSFVYHDVRWCPSVAAAIWTWSMHDHIISHCTWDDIRPFGDVSVGIHSPPSSFSMAMSFHGLCSGPQWPHVASICRGRILRLAFQSTVLAWKLPMASTFELASRWEEYGRIAELWNSLCIFVLNFPINRDDQLSTTIYSNFTGYEHISKHYIYVCVL